MNIERRAAVRDAASAVLHRPSDPLLLDTIADAIAEAIEVALSWQPEPAPVVPKPAVTPSRWSCGCDASECVMRRDQMQDAGCDPHAIVTFTCIGHGLVGKSHPGRVADGLLRLEAQAMLMLDRAHQEQCR